MLKELQLGKLYFLYFHSTDPAYWSSIRATRSQTIDPRYTENVYGLRQDAGFVKAVEPLLEDDNAQAYDNYIRWLYGKFNDRGLSVRDVVTTPEFLALRPLHQLMVLYAIWDPSVPYWVQRVPGLGFRDRLAALYEPNPYAAHQAALFSCPLSHGGRQKVLAVGDQTNRDAFCLAACAAFCGAPDLLCSGVRDMDRDAVQAFLANNADADPTTLISALWSVWNNEQPLEVFEEKLPLAVQAEPCSLPGAAGLVAAHDPQQGAFFAPQERQVWDLLARAPATLHSFYLSDYMAAVYGDGCHDDLTGPLQRQGVLLSEVYSGALTKAAETASCAPDAGTLYDVVLGMLVRQYPLDAEHPQHPVVFCQTADVQNGVVRMLRPLPYTWDLSCDGGRRMYLLGRRARYNLVDVSLVDSTEHGDNPVLFCARVLQCCANVICSFLHRVESRLDALAARSVSTLVHDADRAATLVLRATNVFGTHMQNVEQTFATEENAVLEVADTQRDLESLLVGDRALAERLEINNEWQIMLPAAPMAKDLEYSAQVVENTERSLKASVFGPWWIQLHRNMALCDFVG
jgi:hypothetical protein